MHNHAPPKGAKMPPHQPQKGAKMPRPPTPKMGYEQPLPPKRKEPPRVKQAKKGVVKLRPRRQKGLTTSKGYFYSSSKQSSLFSSQNKLDHFEHNNQNEPQVILQLQLLIGDRVTRCWNKSSLIFFQKLPINIWIIFCF